MNKSIYSRTFRSLFAAALTVGITRPLRAAVSIKAEPLGDMPDPAAIITTVITPNGHDELMAVGRPDGSQSLLMDGHLKANENEIRGAAVSADGNEIAYAVVDAAGWHVVTSGVKGPSYESIAGYGQGKKHFADLFFSVDGKHLAYIAETTVANQKELFAVINGKEEEHYTDVRCFSFSDDGNHWAYAARDVHQNEMCILDRKEGISTLGIHAIEFVPKSQNVVVMASTGKKVFTLLENDREIDPASTMVSKVVFSDDGKHLAYTAYQPGLKWPSVLVMDGQTIAPPSDPQALTANPFINDVALSPDGVQMAYVRADSYKTGKTVSGPDPFRGGIRQGKQAQPRVVCFGASGPIVDAIDNLTFNHDGDRLAYAARIDNQWQIVVHDKRSNIYQGPLFDMLSSQVAFSTDGKHVAYAARKNGKWKMVLDDNEIPDYVPLHERFQEDNDPEPPNPGFRFSFDPDGSLVFIASKGNSLYRVHAGP